MRKFKAPALLCLTGFIGLLFITATSSTAAEIRHKRFMKEFARFVLERADSESRIRADLADLVLKNKKALREGFGRHPELFPEMFRVAGIEKLNCISGRYFMVFQGELNNEERALFYETKQILNHWVLLMAAEEAARLKVINPSAIPRYRQPADIPGYISLALKQKFQPYAKAKLDNEDMRGIGFDGIKCND